MNGVKVKIENPLAGYKVGGLTHDKYIKLSEAERVQSQINFLKERALELKERDFINSKGEQDMNVKHVGCSLMVAIERCEASLYESAITAFDCFVELGKAITNVDRYFLVCEVFRHERPKAEGREKGTANSRITNKEKGEKTKAAVLEKYLSLNNKDERGKAGVIATSLGVSAKTVREKIRALEKEGKIKRT